MRTNATSGISLSFCVSICTLMVLFSVSDRAYAKRGCSAFGHSCFGGHGKRFDPHVRGDTLQDNEITTSNRGQEYETPRLNDEPFLIGPDRKFQGSEERIIETQRQGSQTFDPNALSLLVRRWLASRRRLHDPDLEINNK